MKVEQLMTKDVACCTPSTTLNDAAHMMWQNDCGSLPVLQSDKDRRVVGMITDRDICMAAYHQGKSLKEIAVKDAMSRSVRACAPSDDVSEAEKLMRDAKVRRLPVVDDQSSLVGCLSLAQIVRKAGNGRNADIPGKEVVETLASICEPTPGSRSESAPS